MQDARQELLTYLLTHSSNIIQDIELHKVMMLFPEFLYRHSRDQYKKCIDRHNRQINFNSIREAEMAALTKKATEKGIKLIFFKGHLLAYDLYEHPEYRKSRDIDLLIQLEDLCDVLLIFEECGYNVEYYKELCGSDVDINNIHLYIANGKLHSLNRCYHLMNIYKTIDTIDGKIELPVDIHVRLNNDFTQEVNHNVSKIMERIITVDAYTSIPMYTLELHDRLVQLLYHYSKEIVDKDCTSLLLRGHNRKIELTLLFDIALLIDKYACQISWETVLERALEGKQYGEVLLAMRLLNSVFKNRIPEEYIQKAYFPGIVDYYEDISGGFRKKAIAALLDIDPDVLINAKTSEICQLIISKMQWMGPKIECSNESMETGNYYILDETSEQKLNVYNTYIKNVRRSDICSFKSKFNLKWNDDIIKLHCGIDSAEVINPDELEISVSVGCEKNINSNPFINTFILKLENDKQIFYKKYVDLDANTQIVSHTLDLNEKMCTFTIEIPWDVLELNFEDIKCLWFELTISVNGTQMALADPTHNRLSYDDLTNMAKVILV